MTENEKLRELLKQVLWEAGSVDGLSHSLQSNINDALNEAPVSPVPNGLETALALARAEVEQLRALLPPDVERSPRFVGQGSWSVFAEKVAAERDAARAEVQFLRGVGCNELDGTDVRGPCGACIKCARRERDEARVEVERLYQRLGDRSVVTQAELAHAFTEGTLVMGGTMREKIAEIEAQASDAYRRGAEAMREAAARLFDGDQDTPGLAKVPTWAAEIRSLPIPEGK